MNYLRDTTSGDEGLDLLEKLLSSDGTLPAIVMTAWSSVDLAVEATPRRSGRLYSETVGQRVCWRPSRNRPTGRRNARNRRARWTSRGMCSSACFPQHAQSMRTIVYGGRCLPAREVGGDYYDFLELGPGRLGAMLADVSGKGVAGALLTASLQASFRSQLELGVRHPRALLTSVNKLFHESTPAEYFATMFYGEYRDQGRELRYINRAIRRRSCCGRRAKWNACKATVPLIGIFATPQVRGKEPCDGTGRRVVLVFRRSTRGGNRKRRRFPGEARLRSQRRRGLREKMWKRCSSTS